MKSVARVDVDAMFGSAFERAQDVQRAHKSSGKCINMYSRLVEDGLWSTCHAPFSRAEHWNPGESKQETGVSQTSGSACGGSVETSASTHPRA